MAILNPYSKTTYVNGTAPDLNAVNLNKNEQGVYDVTEKVRELAAYETNAAASAVSAANSASLAAESVADYTGVVEDVADLTTVVSNKANKVQSGWIEPTLINNWVNYGNGYQTCQYMKDDFGVVHIRGIVKSGTSSSTVFVLPVGYRPALNEVFASTQNNSFGTCTIFTEGEVVVIGSGVGTSFCFGNVSFVGV